MKIAFSSSMGGGADTHVRTSAQWLAQHGHIVHVIYSSKNTPEWGHDKSPNIHIHSAPIGGGHYYVSRFGFHRTQYPTRLKQFEASLSLSKAIRSINSTHGLDIVELFEGVAYPRLFQDIPFIVKLHGSNWTFNSYCEDGVIYPFQIRNERMMLMAASQVQSPSRSLADYISGACEIPPRLIKILPYPLVTQDFSAGEIVNSGPPFRLMSVGRLEKRKGTHLTVRALRQIWRHQPDTHLYLYGQNSDFGKNEIEAEIPPDEHRGRIHFEGFVSHKLLIQRYREAHVVVAPTRYDNFPYMIMEAMACGRPVIASDIGGVAELVRHQETGWLIPRDNIDALGQAVLEALCEPKRREIYGRAGRFLAERFDVERIMPQQLALYEEAIHTSREANK